MLPPTAETFTALARSSPWRWSTLRFTARGLPAAGFPPVRAWLRRPARLRIETLDGHLQQIVREAGTGAPVHGDPVFGADGLVERRPGDRWAHDAPMYQNYRWVALLDPLELADGIDPDTDATVPALVVADVRAVEHGGRPAWEAVVVPTPAYEPRCGCCSLLRSREVDLREYRDHPDHVLSAYPEAHRVRLDVQTGVCVATEEIGGLTPGSGHDVRIEAVDEPMPDDLFHRPRRSSPVRRPWGWAQYPGPT